MSFQMKYSSWILKWSLCIRFPHKNVILSRVLGLYRGFGLKNIFIIHLQVVTTNNYKTIAEFHTTNHSTLSLLSLLSLVFTF
jgi:hypothetical protein